MPSRPPRYPTWTAIAARERDSENVWCKVQWVTYPDSPYSPAEARMLGKCGKLLVACKHEPEHVIMLIKTPSRPQP
jgi:hypothetical protein